MLELYVVIGLMFALSAFALYIIYEVIMEFVDDPRKKKLSVFDIIMLSACCVVIYVFTFLCRVA